MTYISKLIQLASVEPKLGVPTFRRPELSPIGRTPSGVLTAALLTASFALGATLLPVKADAADTRSIMLVQNKSVSSEPALSEQKLEQFSRRVEQLESRGVRAGRMSQAELDRYEGEVSDLYGSIKNEMMMMKGTGTADCINSCEFEHSKCMRRNSGFICGIQAAKCLINCGVSVSGQGPASGSSGTLSPPPAAPSGMSTPNRVINK